MYFGRMAKVIKLAFRMMGQVAPDPRLIERVKFGEIGWCSVTYWENMALWCKCSILAAA